MADVEIIFPDKVVGIKPFQLVNLAITVITALLGGAMVMWKVGVAPARLAAVMPVDDVRAVKSFACCACYESPCMLCML